jgi:hypothetical protein
VLANYKNRKEREGKKRLRARLVSCFLGKTGVYFYGPEEVLQKI